MKFNIKVVNLGKLEKRLNRYSEQDVKNAVTKATVYLKSEVKKNTPVDTGALRNSIFHRIEEKNGKIKGIVYTNWEYAPFVEFGTGPIGERHHQGISPDVEPRYSPTGWRYFSEKENKWIYTKGQKAQPFMYSTFKKNKAKINEYLLKEIKGKQR